MAALTIGQLSALDSTARGVCANQIIQTLIDLNLTGPGDRWYFMRVPHLTAIHKSGVNYPLGCVSPWRGSLPDQQGALNRATTTFRYVVGLARSAQFDYQNDADKLMEWDQSIRRAFRKTKPNWLGSEAGVRMKNVTVSDGEAFIAEEFRKGVDAMYYIVDVMVEEDLS